MKQKIKKHSTKKKVKFITESSRFAEVAYTSKFTSVVRYADTTIFDQLLFQDKINNEQYQIAEWLYTLALHSGINISTSSFLSNPIPGSRTSNESISEKSVRCRLTLNKCLDHIKSSMGAEAQSLLEAIVFYQKSIRDWSRSTNRPRQGKMELFKKSLDELIKFRDHHV